MKRNDRIIDESNDRSKNIEVKTSLSRKSDDTIIEEPKPKPVQMMEHIECKITDGDNKELPPSSVAQKEIDDVFAKKEEEKPIDYSYKIINTPVPTNDVFKEKPMVNLRKDGTCNYNKKLTTIEKIDIFYENFGEFLKEKNRRYGDAATKPMNVFSKLSGEDSILIRLDDKLSRIKKSDTLRKNDVLDMIGYLTLLAVEKDWLRMDELLD